MSGALTQEAPTPCQAPRAMEMEMEDEDLDLPARWQEYIFLEHAEERWDSTRVMYQMKLPKNFEGLLWRSWAADLEGNIGCNVVFRSRKQDDENNAERCMTPLILKTLLIDL